MKRFFALILACCLSLGCLAMSALADEAGTISMTASTAVAGSGDTVTVMVSIDSNPGTCLLELIVSYDETRLEKFGDYVATGSSMDNSGVWTFGTNAIWDNDSDSTYTGTIVIMTYKVLDDAPEGEADISISVRSAMDWDTLEDVYFTVTPASVTVESACEHVYDEGVEDADGVTTYTCTVCGYSYMDIPASAVQTAETVILGDETESLTDESSETDVSETLEGANSDSAENDVTNEEAQEEAEEDTAEEKTEIPADVVDGTGNTETSSFSGNYIFWIALAVAVVGIVVIIVVVVTGKKNRQ